MESMASEEYTSYKRTNRGKRVSDYFRAGTTICPELWSSFPTAPFLAFLGPSGSVGRAFGFVLRTST
jgi:hypothetical protein